MEKADRIKVGMSVEQLLKLRETAKHMGIEVTYDVKKGQWTVNPGELIGAFCAVAGIPEAKGADYMGEAIAAITIRNLFGDFINGASPDE